jgi:sec-independent protein translocase protein TatA
MGISGIGIWQLLIILLIVLMLFGSKRLGSLGADLGNAVRGFRRSVGDDTSSEEGPVELPGVDR